ncbi:MAG: response regulator transcription factor [Tannerellaceae bacterium]|jgi:DNA-binding NarL/FixJ family response regulator|nr:response regulator transcription factor [Tannerellaceae bacterium]
MINVHITEDQAMMVELFIPVINASGFARISGHSYTLSECRKKLASECTDVLLLDINMPDGNGLAFCKEIRELCPRMKIIALTQHNEYSCVKNMFKNGASGYVVKSEAVREVLEAILVVMSGKEYISPDIERMISKTTKEAIALTSREMQVLQLVAKGMSYAQIAEHMIIAPTTVNSYQKKLHLKLDAKTRFELIENAKKEGFI